MISARLAMAPTPPRIKTRMEATQAARSRRDEAASFADSGGESCATRGSGGSSGAAGGSSTATGAGGGGAGGGGGGAGKASFQDLSFTRYADGQSPHFLTMLATGQVISAVQLDRGTVRIVLKDVLVTSFSTGGSSQERTETLTENITLNFGRIEFSVNGQFFCFDAVSNTGC